MPLAPAFALLAVLVGFIALSLVASWDVTVKPIMHGIAEAIRNVPITATGRRLLRVGALADAIIGLEQSLRRHLSGVLGFMLAPLAGVMYAIGRAFVYPAVQLEALTRDAGDALWNLRKRIVPALIATSVGPIVAGLRALEWSVAHLPHHAPIHIAKDITNYAKGAFTTIVNTSVAVPWPRIRSLERDTSALWKKVRELTKRVPVALTAAALTAIVARTAFKWVRCAKVGRAGRAVCGMNEQMLTSLLAETALVVGVINLREFAHGMQTVMDEIAPPVRHFWTADVRDRLT